MARCGETLLQLVCGLPGFRRWSHNGEVGRVFATLRERHAAGASRHTKVISLARVQRSCGVSELGFDADTGADPDSAFADFYQRFPDTGKKD